MGSSPDQAIEDRIVELPEGGARAVRTKTATAAEALGGKSALAQYLGVSRSQPGRWISGEERPSPESLRKVLDVEFVWSRLAMLWTEDAARIWLDSPNGHLSGAYPIDVLKLRGAGPVVEAIDAELGGAYP